MATMPIAFGTLTSQEKQQIIPQQLYRQDMETIWENVNQLPEGQDIVVMSQLRDFGKVTRPSPKDFPALATHGFIVEQLVEGYSFWQPATPYLKDFWRIGIQVSNDYGYRLQPREDFQAKLQEQIKVLFS
jgi:hypothetical protein